MGNSNQAVDAVAALLAERERSVAWLARRSKLPYKRVLAEVKHRTRPLSLETAVAVSAALGVEITDLVGLAADDVHTVAVAS